MKHKGCTCYYNEDLRRDLMKAFDEAIKTYGLDHTMSEVYNKVSQMKAPRYYVSIQRAMDVVRSMVGGDENQKLKPYRRAMYTDILERAKRLMEKEGIAMKEAVARVINSPAPSFFLHPHTIKNMVSLLTRTGNYDRD